MCRSIKTLRGTEPTLDEMRQAALQYVRKVSGYRQPSQKNQAMFEAAVEEITTSTQKLLEGIAPAR